MRLLTDFFRLISWNSCDVFDSGSGLAAGLALEWGEKKGKVMGRRLRNSMIKTSE